MLQLSFVSKVLGANYNRANNSHPVADKFAMCTGQGVTFEPTSNAHARVDYLVSVYYIDLITIKPNPAAFYLRHGHYRSHCNHGNVYSQVCHHVYVLCRSDSSSYTAHIHDDILMHYFTTQKND